jgi:Flp pilus assembly protein TadD
VAHRPFFLRTLGFALYRAGRNEEALARLEEAVRAQGKDGGVEDWLLLALVHHRLGHADQARAYLRKARDLLERHEPENVDDKLDARFLRREAEAAVNSDPRK